MHAVSERIFNTTAPAFISLPPPPPPGPPEPSVLNADFLHQRVPVSYLLRLQPPEL